MVLLNDLYTISNSELHEGNAVFNIRLNSGHFIYQAHFPGQPITPGVCIIQIAKELLEVYLKRDLQISQIRNVKFLSVLSPMNNKDVSYSLTKVCGDEETVTSLIFVTVGESQYAKISLACKQDARPGQ